MLLLYMVDVQYQLETLSYQFMQPLVLHLNEIYKLLNFSKNDFHSFIVFLFLSIDQMNFTHHHNNLLVDDHSTPSYHIPFNCRVSIL
jgi:hypothetical protein